jgi:hypothetical protein
MNERIRARLLAGTAILALALLTLLSGGDVGEQGSAKDSSPSVEVTQERGSELNRPAD